MENNQQKKYTKRLKINSKLGDNLPIKILVAEDNMVNQKVALKILDKMGFRADIAANGLKRLKQFKELIMILSLWMF